MDNVRKYVQEARQKQIPDEDIIMELSKYGWSIQQVHQLLYNDHPTSPSNPVWPTQNIQQQPIINTATPQISNTAVPQVQQQQAPAEPLSILPQPEQLTKTKHRLRKILLVVFLFVFVFALGVGTGVGGGYLYITSQIKKYTPAENAAHTENSTPTSSESTITSVSNEPSASSSPKANNSAPASASGSGAVTKSSCPANSKSVPDGVCVAIESIIKNSSPSNPYFSNYKGEIPSGVKIISVDINTWSPQSSTKGTVEAVASLPVIGNTSLTALFENISGEWKVIEIY